MACKYRGDRDTLARKTASKNWFRFVKNTFLCGVGPEVCKMRPGKELTKDRADFHGLGQERDSPELRETSGFFGGMEIVKQSRVIKYNIAGNLPRKQGECY